MNALLAALRRRPAGDPTADGDLLARFLEAGDEDAFAGLVGRHAELVYGACRRHLPDPADAEDAFQAVWLVLVRRAGRLTGRRSLGPWLYRVAVWTARNLRRRNARRLVRTQPFPPAVPGPADPTADRLDLDDALLALPEKYRTPVVLCHLQGWSRRDAAAHLGCPEGTLSALLSRALARLRKRLAGADPTLPLTAAGVTVPAGLATAAVRTAGAFRTASLSAAGVSPAVADLTRGVLRMFWVKKLAAAGLVLAAVVTTGLGIGIGYDPTPRATAQAPKAGKPAAGPTPEELADKIKQLEADLAKLKQLAAVLQQKREIEHLKDKLTELNTEVRKVEPSLRLVVGRPTWLGIDDLEVEEYDRGGMKVGYVRCSNLEALKRHLARAFKDPAGPKKLTVSIPPDYKFADEKAILDAIKAAGVPAIEMAPPRVTKGAAPAHVDPAQLGRPGPKAYSLEFVRPSFASVVVRVAMTGNETVLDALKTAGVSTAGQEVVVVRGQERMAVDLDAITRRGDDRTNHPLQPGDRVVIREAHPQARPGGR